MQNYDCFKCGKIFAGDEIAKWQGKIVCKDCHKREKANYRRKERNELMRSLGLTKVRGAVSGRVYWE